MKVVYFDPLKRRDTLGDAFKTFPEVTFLRCGDVRDLADALNGAGVLLIGNRSYTADAAAIIAQSSKTLKWIQFTSSGLDNARKYGLPPGVTVTNAAGLRTGTVAEHAFALMLGVARRLQALEHAKARQDWCRDAITPQVISLTGKHILIVGLGSIGQDIARKAKAFDMTVTGVSRSAGPFVHVDAVRPREEMVAACAEADVVVMSATFDPATGPLLRKEAIDAMKPGAIVINVAKGALIDEAALIAALDEGRIAGAGLDVSRVEPIPSGHALWTLERALLTPHIAGAGADESGKALHILLADNMRRWLSRTPLQHVVS
jgi:phosphoglycerate dehydrogenase-like enzyme